MKNSVITERVNSTETLQKQQFISVLSDPRKKYSDCLNFIENELNQSKKMAEFNHKILCFKEDGVFQLHKAIKEIFGVAEAKADNSPSGDSTMQTIDVQLADGTRHKVPYGQIALEGLGPDAYIDIQYSNSSNILVVKGKCQFRFSSLIDDIILRTLKLLETESIYSCQAIEINNNMQPKIMNLSNIDKELMVLSDSTEYELQPLKSRILHPSVCVKKGIPLKYGCLLEGPYGTGRNIIVNLFVA